MSSKEVRMPETKKKVYRFETPGTIVLATVRKLGGAALAVSVNNDDGTRTTIYVDALPGGDLDYMVIQSLAGDGTVTLVNEDSSFLDNQAEVEVREIRSLDHIAWAENAR